MELQELNAERVSVPFYPCAFGAQSSRSSSYLLSESPISMSSESISSCVSLPHTTTCANTQISLERHFVNNCNSCKFQPSTAFQQSVRNHHSVNLKVSGYLSDRQGVVGFGRTAIHCGDSPTRVREINMYQGFTGSYNRIPGYIDVSVVQNASTSDHKYENPFAVEGYQTWNWSTSWGNQMFCPKEQTQDPLTWKSSLTEQTTTYRPDDTAAILRRGRKKRVPYTKFQLNELEHEYTIAKFITKEKRRRIASSTNLSERQVTIWFQNRRVKDKKIISKTSKDCESYF